MNEEEKKWIVGAIDLLATPRPHGKCSATYFNN
jgi:hypothetical protein